MPASPRAIDSLRRAVAVQGAGRNLIPADKSWKQWTDHVHHVWAAVRDRHGLGKLHDLRAAFACERYQCLTKSPAPVIAGRREALRERDRYARHTIALELGHARVDVVSAYIGGAK